MERRHSSVALERARLQRGKKFTRLVERVTERGIPFADPQIGEGRRVIGELLKVSAWTKTFDGHQTQYREVMMGGVPVFLSTATIQGQIERSSEVLIFKPGPWEKSIRRLFSSAQQATA